MTITLGGSYDDFNPDDEEGIKGADQFNPKVGLTWDLKSGTTLRGAAFRVLKRSLITDQTLEPTQVAGFNQFFDELNATDYWVYGGAVDQKFTGSFIWRPELYLQRPGCPLHGFGRYRTRGENR